MSSAYGKADDAKANGRAGRLPAVVWLVTFWVVLGAIIHASHSRLVLQALPPGASAARERVVVPKPEVVKVFSLGFDQLVADLWWLAFIQYYGDSRARELDNYRQAYSFLDLVTRLDPRFTQPYWFASFAVGGDAGRPDLARELIERGIRANQDNWYLPFIAGVNQYLFAHDDSTAAKYYRMAARFPGAPPWLSGQADMLEAGMPTVLKQANTYTLIYLTAAEPMVKDKARSRLIPIWIKVYKEAPSQAARERALAELKRLDALEYLPGGHPRN